MAKKKNNLEKELRDKSFKIKPILLELPNYGYYHTAVDGNDADLNKRFIGRKTIINKIRSFIFETTSDTGAYLVTGFRGMGKTSVINEALSILNPKLNWLNHIALIFALFPLLLFRNEAILNWTFVVFAWAFVGVLWFLYFVVYSRHSQNKARKGKNVFFDMFRWMFDRVHYTVQSKSEKNYHEPYRLIRIVNLYSFLAALTVTTWFFLNFTDKTDQLWSIPLFYITIARLLFLKERYSKYFQKIKKGHDLNFGLIGIFNSRYRKYIFLSIHLFLGAVLTLPVFFIFCQKDIEIHFGFYLLFGFVAWNLFISVVDRYFAQNLSNKDSLYQSQLFGLRSFLNFQHYHQVHINLGKDDLTEKDVLKFITSEFYQVYKKWYSDYINVKRILNVGFIYFFVFIIINATFYMLPKQVLQDEINNTFGLSDFFPSQELTTVGSGGYIHMDSIEDLDHYFQTLTVFSHIDVLADSLKKIVGKPNSITHVKLAQILSDAENWEMTEAKPTTNTNAIFQKEVNNQMEGYTFHFTEAGIRVLQNSMDPSKVLAIIDLFKKKLAENGIQGLPKPLGMTKDTTRTHRALCRDFSIDLKKYGYVNLNPEKLVIQKVNIKGANGENDTTFVNSTSIFESFKYSMARYANGLDFIILYYYTSFRKTILPEHILEESNASLIGKMNNDETESHHFLHSLLLYVFPPTPNYLVFFFFFTLLFILYLIPSNWLPFTLHRHNLKRLKKLKEEIAATTSEERNGGGLKTQYSWFNTKRSFNKEPLDTKEITQELIHILEETSKVPSVFVKTKVIFVLDELDKIEINYNSTLSSKEEEQSPKPKNQGYHTYRRERIASILSSMKHFLNSAKAKFIFIAGREMYDAALAGISDRESSLDSIFNDNKIYVGSFYIEGEDDRWADITGTTENYVCRFLFPKKYTERTDFDQYNLKTYAKYLKNLEAFKDKDTEIVKIITTLKDFIVYLTYRSNGAPRKLSNIFEQHVQNLTEAEFNDDGILRVGPNNNSMYLRFSYYTQYKASLISYLVSPVFLQLGNFMHEYSDKLLVSISYMLDHLFKHHKAGLSYRSLSLAPEIVDVNKEPEFRNFLERLIENMSTNHLGVIVSGIYDFKFNSKIASEFKLLSKINEQETAAFNFTQDETIEIKKHFHSRLQAIKSDQRNSQQNGDPFHDYTNSESFLKMLLGDLYFQDEQYFDATNYYMDAIQILRLQELDKMNIYNFILLIRNKLKLALAFEKNKIYDNALMTYAEISNSILQKAAIEEESIGQVNWQNKKVFQNYFFSSIENIRILYQPIVAKLHLIQKSTPNKLSKRDILRAMEEFEFLKKKSLGDPKLIIESEFYNKIGDLLFYRNGTLLVSAQDKYRVDTPIDAALFYIQSLCVILRIDLQVITAWYKKIKVGETEINEQNNLLWKAVENILLKKESLLIKHTYDELITISNSLVDLASCLISLLPKEKDQEESKQNDILKLFFLSARIFEQIGKPTLAKSQYLKVLHLARVFKVERQKLNQIIQKNGSKEYSNENTEAEKDQLEKFMDHLKVLCHQAYSAASRIESAKMEEIFAGTVNSNDHVQSSLVIENDIQEVEMLRLFYDLKVNKNDEDIRKKAIEYVYKNIHSHALVRKKFNRIIQLELRLECNGLWYDNIKEGKTNSSFYLLNQENKLTDIERNKFLVIDSIGCCHELMKLHELIGVNYVSTSNMTFHNLAKKFVLWIGRLEEMKATMEEQNKDDINRLLKSILNSETLMYINKEYYQDMQKQYELKVENFHTQGSPLREFVKNESYLDDFYNDKIIHFSIAMERFQWLRNRKSSTNNQAS